jgi:hypothetical protein
MKENMNDNAPFLEYPNGQNPKPRGPIHYGDRYVPHPTNAKAKEVSAAAVMDAVNKAK